MPKPKLQRIKNTSDLDTATLRRIAKFCMPENVASAHWHMRAVKSRYAYAGCYIPSTLLPGIKVRLGCESQYPLRLRLYQYAQHKGRKHYLRDIEEAAVYVIAHELRHMWQQHGKMKNSIFPVGWVRNSKGKYSEVDTEAYAIHTLRAWRKHRAELLPEHRRPASLCIRNSELKAA